MPTVILDPSESPTRDQRRRQQRRAHGLVALAIKHGELRRPDACVACGASGVFIDLHHIAGYSDDVALLVQPLCPLCHKSAGHPRFGRGELAS